MIVQPWPLFGRSAELDRVGGLLRSGERAGVVLVGEAGVGKTRLGEECLAMARSMSFAVSRIKATECAAELPLGAFGPLLPPPSRKLRAPKEMAAILSQVRRAIAEGAGAPGLALLVDDAHLLDNESAILVHQLATTRSAFVVTTMRSEVVAPEPLVALWKDETVARLDLAPLSPALVDALLTAVLGGSVDGATRHYLVDRTGGNVQLLREVVLAALDAGVLHKDGGVWRLAGAPPPSARLVDLVESGLHRLSSAEHGVLETVACAEPVGVALLAELVDPRHLESLERRRLLKVSRHGRRREARLAHPVHGDVLRGRMPAIRSQAVRRALADAVEAAGMQRREDVLRVVEWRLDGGGRIPTALAMAAADRAHHRGDLDMATRLAEAAVEGDAGFEAELLAGCLTGLRGQGELAEYKLAALDSLDLTDAQRALLAASRGANLLMGLGRPREAIRVLEDAETSGVDQEWRDELSSKRAYVLLCTDAPAEALAIAEPLVRGAKGRALSEACVVRAAARAHAGRLAAALDACRTGEAAVTRTPGMPVFWPHWIHRWNRCDILARFGELDRAEDEARANYDTAVVEGSRAAQAAFARSLSRVARGQGRMATAVAWAREAVGLLRRGSWECPLRWALADLAWALAVGGESEEATAAVAEYDALEDQIHVPLRADIDHARAWLAAARGDMETAHAVLRRAADRAASNGAFAVEAAALHDLARLGAPASAVPRLAELARVVEGPVVTAQAHHVAALVRADGREIEAASTAFERMGAVLLAAEAAAAAACAGRRTGDVRWAALAERRAVILAGRCEGAVTPMLANQPRRVALTAREREVAGLAAGGLSNRQITEQLFLSVRTVENQLQRAYAKLGIRSRAELAEVLRSQ